MRRDLKDTGLKQPSNYLLQLSWHLQQVFWAGAGASGVHEPPEIDFARAGIFPPTDSQWRLSLKGLSTAGLGETTLNMPAFPKRTNSK